MTSGRDIWRIPAGHRPHLDRIDTRSEKGAPGDKQATRALLEGQVADLAELQNRLWAEHERSLLLVLQAMDAGGKDGTVRKVFSGVNPQGVKVTSFKQPSAEELRHDFLWRVHQHTPRRGFIQIFNRSHYEDVLVARVEGLVPEATWRERFTTLAMS